MSSRAPCPLPGTPEGRARHRGLHETICPACRAVPVPGRSQQPGNVLKRARVLAVRRLINRFPEVWDLFYAVERAKAYTAAGLGSQMDWEYLEHLLRAASGGHTPDCEPEKGPDYCVGHAA